MAKYSVTQSAVTQLLADVKSDHIAIPELQRPFVWDSIKVRDLMDSLYKGYPVGYLITWQSVGAKLKGGQVAAHQQILIDGQQRITALRAAVAGLKVINKRYKAVRITIAFNPITEEFATLTPVIGKNPQWISDISEFFNADSPLSFAREYLERNPDVDAKTFETNLARLGRHQERPDRHHRARRRPRRRDRLRDLHPDQLQGRPPQQRRLRHEQDRDLRRPRPQPAQAHRLLLPPRGRTPRLRRHQRKRPRVRGDALPQGHQLAEGRSRGPLRPRRTATSSASPASSASAAARRQASSASCQDATPRPGRSTRTGSRSPTTSSSVRCCRSSSKYHFDNFLMIIKSAGFISPGMIGSKNALNFAYALYLRLRADKAMSEGERKRIVRSAGS